MDLWKKAMPEQLAVVLTSTASLPDMQNLLRDLLTEKEIYEISARLQAARMLTEGKKYTEITQQTRLSSRTVARISEWLKNGENGYQSAIEKINTEHIHMPPGRD